MKLKLILFLVMISFVSAGDVVLIGLHYEDGKLTVSDKKTLIGYYPDRKINEGNYYLAIDSLDGEIIYSFRFDVPNKIYTDSSEGGGGVIILDKVDFGLLVPYFSEAKEINVYKGDEKLLVVPNPGYEKKNYWGLVFFIIIILVIVAGALFLWLNRNTYKK